ncbi:MAG: hypothetical protein HKM24_08175 [Gammaproteobacteria bacterium]|nr:hypothetical protein [Gammaproteobacteria bacterium]
MTKRLRKITVSNLLDSALRKKKPLIFVTSTGNTGVKSDRLSGGQSQRSERLAKDDQTGIAVRDDPTIRLIESSEVFPSTVGNKEFL